MGLSSDVDAGSLIFCFFLPALPWPNLGLIWDTPFASEAIMGFITCFSDLIFGCSLFSMPCTSGKLMPLDLASYLVWTKYFPSISSPILYYLDCRILCILNEIGMISCELLSSCFCLDKKSPGIMSFPFI